MTTPSHLPEKKTRLWFKMKNNPTHTHTHTLLHEVICEWSLAKGKILYLNHSTSSQYQVFFSDREIWTIAILTFHWFREINFWNYSICSRIFSDHNIFWNALIQKNNNKTNKQTNKKTAAHFLEMHKTVNCGCPKDWLQQKVFASNKIVISRNNISCTSTFILAS